MNAKRAKGIMSATFLLGAVGAASAATGEERPPNVIFILVDDLGWSDLGCYGSEYYETPHIDRMAEQGIRFTDAYVTHPVCAPSRATILTGQYGPRGGHHYGGSNPARGDNLDQWMKFEQVESTRNIEPGVPLISAPFKAAGYRTAVFGKWHNGNFDVYHPLQRGFDEGWSFVREHQQERFGPFVTRPETEPTPGRYMADFVTDHVIDFIERNQEGPFFAYVPYFAVHATDGAPAPPDDPELIEKYRNKPPHNGDDNPYFAAMIDNLDSNVGRILATLDEKGLRDNTMIIFFSDNGGVGNYSKEMGLRNQREWTSNYPLRGGKYMMRDGGIRVPLIVHWPQGIPVGGVITTPVISVDLFPTFVELTGEGVDPSHVLDGVSLLPLLKAGPDPALEERSIFWHHPHYYGNPENWGGWKETPCSVIRKGDYKLIFFYEDNRPELFNLREDIGENRDLSLKMPELTQLLQAELKQWIDKIGAPVPRRIR